MPSPRSFSQKGKLFQIEYALNAIQNVSCSLPYRYSCRCCARVHLWLLGPSPWPAPRCRCLSCRASSRLALRPRTALSCEYCTAAVYRILEISPQTRGGCCLVGVLVFAAASLCVLHYWPPRCTDKKLPTKLMDAEQIHKCEEVTSATGMVSSAVARISFSIYRERERAWHRPTFTFTPLVVLLVN
jgi:hypothetical protein